MSGCGACGSKLTWRQFFLCFLGSVVSVALIVIFSIKMEATAATSVKGCLTKDQVVAATTTMNKCLTIFGGGVYDFTAAKKWDLTGHVGGHLCGKEYSKETIEEGPHKLVVIDKFFFTKVCGAAGNTIPLGIKVNWFRLSAYLSLVFFVLNFATCFAMPWGKFPEPWKGSRPGKDKSDFLGAFPWTHWHKVWAWLAIFTLGIHGLLGFMGVLFGKWY